MNAQSLFTSGVQEIFSYLSEHDGAEDITEEATQRDRVQRRDYIAASATCKTWYHAAMTQRARGWSYVAWEEKVDLVTATNNFTSPLPLLQCHLTSLSIEAQVDGFSFSHLLFQYPALKELYLITPSEIEPQNEASISMTSDKATEGVLKPSSPPSSKSFSGSDATFDSTSVPFHAHANLRGMTWYLRDYHQEERYLPALNRLSAQLARCTHLTAFYIEELPWKVDLSALIHCQQIVRLGLFNYRGGAVFPQDLNSEQWTSIQKAQVVQVRNQMRIISQLSQLRLFNLIDPRFAQLIPGLVTSSSTDDPPIVFRHVSDFALSTMLNLGPGLLTSIHSLVPSLTKLDPWSFTLAEFDDILKFERLESISIDLMQFEEEREQMISVLCRCCTLTELVTTKSILSSHEWQMLLSSLPLLTKFEFRNVGSLSPFIHLMTLPTALTLATQIRSLTLPCVQDANINSILLSLLHLTECENLRFHFLVTQQSTLPEQVKTYMDDSSRMSKLKFLLIYNNGQKFVWDREKKINTNTYRLVKEMSSGSATTQ